ncbi:MAG TPA: AMP-binding protein [Dehalococcoidia bacterium]|nr:AMP-binding protein [Dehalococcoidia bacterium]
MPKTIAITPSWYWPQGVPRVIGVPPYSLGELCIDRPARVQPEELALIAGDIRLTTSQLKEAVDLAAASHSPGTTVEIGGRATVDSVITLFAALKGGTFVRLADTPGSGGGPAFDGAADMRQPAISLAGVTGEVSHSHRSILASALSLVTFIEAAPQRPWLVSLPMARWEGLLSLISPLLTLSPAVLAPEGGDPEETVRTMVAEQTAFAFDDLESVYQWTRDAKRATRDARRLLEGFMLSAPAMFDPDSRRRVGRSFECPALTVYGTGETGPIFASHSSWYLDESIGLPLTNMHVVPADPRTGAPIQALWELVESAEVTAFSPALFCADESHTARFVDGRYRTGVMASSDANGMIYLIG